MSVIQPDAVPGKHLPQSQWLVSNFIRRWPSDFGRTRPGLHIERCNETTVSLSHIVSFHWWRILAICWPINVGMVWCKIGKPIIDPASLRGGVFDLRAPLELVHWSGVELVTSFASGCATAVVVEKSVQP